MRILSFDIESCNGNPREASLCSFGYCIADENFNVIEKADILVNPVPKRFTLGNKWGKGIKLAYPEKDFRKAPLFCEVYDKIAEIFSSCDLVIGFSIINDLNYLNCACCYYSQENFKFKFIDVQSIYSLIHNGENASLDKIMQVYSVEFKAHQSDEDAWGTLILLKKLCQEKAMSIKELLDYYGIVHGENGKGGYKVSYSLAQMTEKHGLKRTTKLSRYLFLKHLEGKKKGCGELKGQSFHFSKKLIVDDLDKSRNLVNGIYLKGGVYSLSLEDAKVLVTLEKEVLENTEQAFAEKNGSKVLSVNQLESILGEYPKEYFEDSVVIKKFFNKRTYLIDKK